VTMLKHLMDRIRSWAGYFKKGHRCLGAGLILLSLGCHSNARMTIAVIPRTSGTGLWEPEHGGAESAAFQTGVRIYWNAPTREDDVEGQIALVEQVIARGYQGLVLAPDQALALITPVRRALSRGVPTVIVGSPLPIPAGGKLSYILNDEETGGRIAGQRVAELLHGRGAVAVLGLNPDVSGIMTRARSLEVFLAKNYPDIRVVKKMGSFNFLHEQQVAEETLKSSPAVDAIVGLTWASARGAVQTIEASPRYHSTKVIGFDPDGDFQFDSGILDSAIVQDTRAMGQRAVDQIYREHHGQPMPSLTLLEPTLVNRNNAGTPEIRRLLSMDWRPGQWNWSATP
jgi:ribose transport system substrate-binding protein